MRAMVITLFAALALLTTGGCTRRARIVETDVQVPVTSGGSSGGGVVITEATPPPTTTSVEVSGQLLYIPADAAALLDQVAQIVVQTSDGQTFQLSRADLVQAAFGRMALRVPAGVTTGTVTVYFLNGRQYSTTFHIAVSGSQQFVGTIDGYSDPRCHEIDGTWVGNISADPSSRATMQVEVLGDCRTIRGFIHFESGGGSVDSTIDGTWDSQQGLLVGRDTQLFNVSPGPGGSFCATDEYVMHLEPDGVTFAGRNITRSYACEGDSPVYLQHVGR